MTRTPFDGTEACTDVPVNDFFPVGDETAPAAHLRDLVCGGCPLAAPCLDFALATYAEGIWAGTTTAERKAIRRARGIPSPQSARRAERAARIVHLHARGLDSTRIRARTGEPDWFVARVISGASNRQAAS